MKKVCSKCENELNENGICLNCGFKHSIQTPQFFKRNGLIHNIITSRYRILYVILSFLSPMDWWVE